MDLCVERCKSIQWFRKYVFWKVWTQNGIWFDKFLTHDGQIHMDQMGKLSMTSHNYRSRQLHRTLNGVNLSGGFEIWVSQSLDPNGTNFDKSLAHGLAHMRQLGKWPWRCITSGLGKIFHITLYGENPSSGFRDMCFAKSGKRLDRYDNTPPVRWAEGERGL